jgi:glycosyltransferase involved in cell wall biosynthesis
LIVLFWLAASTIGYILVLFPLMVLGRARLAARPHVEADITPTMTLIIAAHNEQADLPAKLENVLLVDYPSNCLEVIVASDGSTDRTVELARAVAGSRVQVLDLPRSGKAGALNAALELATGEIVAFTDANSMLGVDSLRALVRPFADPEVGGVAGNQVYTQPDAGAVAGELAHWDVDRVLKTAASRSGSIVSATGALYALRRELVQPVIDGVTDDFYVSTGVIVAGRRLVFAPEATVHEPVSSSTSEEYGRKRRVMTRGFRSVIARRELLNPLRHGWDSVQLITYKLLRRLLAIPVLTIGVASVALRRRHPLYRVVAGLQLVFWVAAAVGYVARGSRLGAQRVVALPMFVAMGLIASVQAAVDVLTGREIRQWTPARPAVADDNAVQSADPGP